MFSHLCLFVCLSASRVTEKLTTNNFHSIWWIFTKFGGEVARRGPRKKPLDVGGNPDRVTLGLWVSRVGL